MPQVYFTLPAADLEALDFLAERDFDGGRPAGRVDMEGR